MRSESESVRCGAFECLRLSPSMIMLLYFANQYVAQSLLSLTGLYFFKFFNIFPHPPGFWCLLTPTNR